MTTAAQVSAPDTERGDRPDFDARAPGERYYRHPGDVVRLVIWGVATVILVLFIELATGTDEGLRDDLGEAAALIPHAVRELALAAAQFTAALVPLVVAVVLVVQRRWRRLGVLVLAVLLGAGLFVLLDHVLGVPGPVAEALRDDSWFVSTRFPSSAYLAAAAAAGTVGKPWLSRAWRRASDRGLLVLVLIMLVAGTTGLAELLLAFAVGSLTGAALLVILGAPNRRPSPLAVANGMRAAHIDVTNLTLERAEGGRSQLYRASLADGTTAFVKVYGRDSRDADLLYRGYRALVLRDSGDEWPSPSSGRDTEHEALMLLLARRGDVRCPDLRALVELADGSTVVVMEDIAGRRLDTVPTDDLSDGLLDELWRETATLHRAGIAHRALRAANVLVAGDGPVIIDFGAAEAPADGRALAFDRAELLASTAELVGPRVATAAAARALEPDELAAASPYLQPLALSAATRKGAGKALLKELRDDIAGTTGQEQEPLERLVRVRPKTLLMIATLTGAFYFLLPQLANVDDSVRALRSANWAWLAGAVVTSSLTYVAAAVGMSGGVRQPIPLVPTTEAQLASSFVNRVTPANVGGMALNVRFLQKVGVEPTDAVTAMGLNVLAGAIVHIVLLFVFFAWAGRTGGGFALPSSSKLLVVLAVVLAVLGLALATRRGRRIVRTRVLRSIKNSLTTIGSIARSPKRMIQLFGGSTGVTLAYIAALACACNAFNADVSIAQVGAVYLGSSILAAAAPTPGGLGAMEAALVAGFTAMGLDSGIAVAAVLSYRLATFWLPILPGWLSFRLLERRNFI
jgi:uncharacterized protein (TIRG00374 family)